MEEIEDYLMLQEYLQQVIVTKKMTTNHPTMNGPNKPYKVVDGFINGDPDCVRRIVQLLNKIKNNT